MTEGHVFGSSYYPPHHEPAEWPRDLDRMHAAGQRVVRTAELLASWDRLEVAKHTYDWTWLDTFVDLLEERGMQVLLGTGSQNPPIWMVDEYDDLQVVARDGVPYPTAAMWAWACKDHPGYRAEAERHVRALAERYGERPALYGWQIDNEPGYPFIPWRGEQMAEYCYCPHTETVWRDWLQQRYGDLDSLSDAWRWDPTHHRYSSWTQVRAPRATPSEWGVVTAWLDWREFTAERLTGWVAWQSALLRELTPGRPTSTNVFIWSRNDAFGVRMGQDPWRLATVVDAIGYDLYPGIGKRFLHQPAYVGMFLDHARSAAAAAGVPLWLPEVESGPLNGWALGPDHATTPADITRICTDVLGAGSRLTLYQGWREWPCIPIHWGALVDFDGEPTPRHDAAAAVAQAVAREPELFARADAAPPAVGILVDHANATAMQGMGADETLLEAIYGAYAGLHGFEVGFLTPAELDRSTHRLVVAPFLLLVAESTGAALRRYVERGGHLLTSAKSAMLDGRGWSHRVRPGAGLDTLLGVVEESIDTIDGWEPVRVHVPGGVAHGAHHVQRFRLTAPDVLVVGTYDDGSPALTRRSVGSGVAWACGTHLDLGVTRHGDVRAAALIGSVASAAGVTPLWTSPLSAQRGHNVWARLRCDGDRGLLTVTSTDSVHRTARIHLAAAGARDLLTDEEVAGGDPFEVRVPAHGSRMLVLEGVRRPPR